MGSSLTESEDREHYTYPQRDCSTPQHASRNRHQTYRDLNRVAKVNALVKFLVDRMQTLATL